MTREDAILQAEALADYLGRGGSWSRWWWSKGFSRSDRAAIRAAYRRLRATAPAAWGRILKGSR